MLSAQLATHRTLGYIRSSLGRIPPPTASRQQSNIYASTMIMQCPPLNKHQMHNLDPARCPTDYEKTTVHEWGLDLISAPPVLVVSLYPDTVSRPLRLGYVKGSKDELYSLKACSAWLKDTILRLRPLFNPGFIFVIVGLRESCHLRKTLFISRGMPSSTTVETGTNGLSSMLDAKIAYSCAKSSALWNDAYWDCARDPTTMYNSKKASIT